MKDNPPPQNNKLTKKRTKRLILYFSKSDLIYAIVTLLIC